MKAEDFLNQWEPSNEKKLDAESFLKQYDPKPVGTSIGQEISQIPAALKQSFGQPLEAIGETAQVAGFPAVATALKGAIQEPEGYVSAGQRFMEPQEGEFQVAGFAPQYAPRAIAEQTGQILGSIGTRIAGAVTLGGLGALISPATGVAGTAVGSFAGPALFEAAQIVGPVALERAKNNGYTEPTDEDMAYAVTTAAGSGLLNAFGAKYLPGGEKAVGSFSKRLAVSFLGEGVPEGLQSLVQQVGETVETKKGIQVNPKQAVGEALIGGGAGAAATIVSAPFTPEQIAEAKIDESANKEAENLFIGNDNPQGKAVLANKQKLEQEVADTKQILQTIEATDPEAQKLKLELKEKEATLAAAQTQVDSIVDSNNPVVEAEKQQIELAKAITKPAPKPLPTDVLPTETPSATYGREAEIFDVFAGARRKPVVTEEPPVSMVGKEVIPGVTPVPVVEKTKPAPTEPTVKESLTVAPEAPAAKELQIGDEITIMQVPSVLADTKKIAGVKWDIFNGAKLAEKRASVRITDEESGEVLQIKQFKNYDEAETYFKTETDKAQKLEKPAPEVPAITPATVAETPAVTEAPAAEVAPAIEPLTDDQAETIRDVITLRKSQGREPNPEQVKRLAEYDARKAGVEVQEGDIISNIVVGHPMFEAPQPELSNLVPIKVQNKEQLESPIQRTQQVRDAAQSYIGQYQVEQAKAKTPAQKKAFAKKFNKSELDRQRDILDYIKNDVMPELDRLEKSAPSATPAVSETITPAAEVATATQVEQEIEVGDEASVNLAGRNETVTIARIEDINGVPTAYFDYFGYKSRPLSEMQLAKKSKQNIAKAKAKEKVSQIEIEKPKPEDFFSNEEITSLASGKAPDGWEFNFKSRDEFPLMDKQGKRWTFEPQYINGKIASILMRAEGQYTGVTIEYTPTPAVSETITPAAEPAGKAEEVTPRKPATFPTMPSIEEQTAEKVYGGETGLYDPFAGVQKKRTKAEDPAGRRGTEDQIKNADEHAAEIGGTVLYQDGDISLIRGYSLWGGNPVYIVANKSSRARTDISSYTGNLATPEQKAQLVDIKNKIEAEDQASFNSKPFITFTDGIAFSNGVPSTIAGVLRDWKSLLNIKANLYVTTYDDAVADKDKFNGPHRVIGSAGLTSSKVDGSIRKMPNGDFYIMFREIPSRTKMLETLAHELGHLHEKEAFENADTATKRMLREEHDKWVKSQTGKTAKELVTSLRAVKTAKANLGAAEGMMADELSAYWKSFGEWYADQVSRWAVSTEKPLTIVDKFFSRIAKALRSFYANLTNRGYLPNETFVQYLEKTLKEPARIVSEPIMEGEGVEQLSQQLGGEPTGKPEQIKGEKIGPLKTTSEGIIAKTQELLRKKFDPAKVSDNNTTEAFRALGRLTGRGGTDFAKELNDVGRVVDESGAASEISMGAALFINDLFEYSIRLAAEGNKKLLGMMLTNINKLPTAAIGVSDAARDLRARLELAQRFLKMAQAEQDAYTNYVAEFIYGPNPTKDQIQSIKDAYAAVEKTPEVSEQELTDELESVGGRTGTDLVGKIKEEFTKATEKGREKRKTEEAELDTEYKKVQRQADAEIEKLAKIQSDTPSFDPAAARQITNDVRAIVANDLKQRPDMGRKAPWKSLLVAKLQEAGVEVAAAETLADIVWRQHEINSLSRELSSINKAIEKGPISEIVKAIKDTPLEDQQNPNWRYEVMRDYLRKAGLPTAQAERIAKLMDISLQKRFTMAQEQAFTDAISKTAPWKAGDTRSRRAFQKVLQALRAGALDPARNVLSDMAALNGWTGFSPDQYKTLLKNDAILADPKSGELKKAEAYKAIQDVISKAKLPIRARDVIGQYYDAQALSGIPTFSVNAFSPIAFALRNTLVEIGSGTLKGNPKAITNAATALVDSIKSWANTVAFSFKNNVTVYSNVDYIVNDDNLLRLYRKGVDQFNKGKTPRDKADGVKNMMVGIMDYVRRMLNALDYGAIASLQNQNISKYSMAVMKRQGMSIKEGNEMFAVMMKAKNDFYLDQIAIGTDKNKASILADEFYISSWNEALTKAGVEKSDIKQAMDAAINDALSSVGRNRQSIDALKDEATKLKDAGVSSMPALWLLESMANAANQSDNQILKLFSRVIYGFAIVPARVIRETAWFSPYGFVRFGYDAIAKRMGKTSPYAQSLGTDVQYSQRLNEAIAGTVALTALFALRAGSTDEPEEDDFKIVFTGNGPQRKDDPQFYDSWYKAGNKPNTMSVSFGKGKFDLNMMRGFEAFTWPAMMLGALDDLEIRKKQKQQTKTPLGLEDASIVAGFVFDAALRRGPYAFTTKSLFGTYGDIGVEGVAKGLTFPAKTLIPVLGTSLASNLSNFLNDPIDRRTLDGAVWSNIPFIGPAVAPKSLNAFGEPALSTDFASKMFKLGVPIVYDIPTDRESIKLHELVLKQGGGPSIPTRNQLAQRLDRQPTNKEYEMFVQEYGTVLTTSMKKNYDKLFDAKPEFYSKAVERIGNRARDVAENKVRQAAQKP